MKKIFGYLVEHQQLIATLSIAVIVLLPALAMGQGTSLPRPIESVDDIKRKILCQGAGLLFSLSIIMSVIFVLYAAFLYVTAAGDEKKVSQARATITYAAIGVAVAILAGGLPTLIGSVLDETVGNPCTSSGGGGWSV